MDDKNDPFQIKMKKIVYIYASLWDYIPRHYTDIPRVISTHFCMSFVRRFVHAICTPRKRPQLGSGKKTT